MIPLFWTSGDISSGQPYLHLAEVCVTCSPRFTSGAIPADLLVASMVAKPFFSTYLGEAQNLDWSCCRSQCETRLRGTSFEWSLHGWSPRFYIVYPKNIHICQSNGRYTFLWTKISLKTIDSLSNEFCCRKVNINSTFDTYVDNNKTPIIWAPRRHKYHHLNKDWKHMVNANSRIWHQRGRQWPQFKVFNVKSK